MSSLPGLSLRSGMTVLLLWLGSSSLGVAADESSAQQVPDDEAVQLLRRRHPLEALTLEFVVTEATVNRNGLGPGRQLTIERSFSWTYEAAEDTYDIVVADLAVDALAHESWKSGVPNLLRAREAYRAGVCVVFNESAQGVPSRVEIHLRPRLAILERPETFGRLGHGELRTSHVNGLVHAHTTETKIVADDSGGTSVVERFASGYSLRSLLRADGASGESVACETTGFTPSGFVYFRRTCRDFASVGARPFPMHTTVEYWAATADGGPGQLVFTRSYWLVALGRLALPDPTVQAYLGLPVLDTRPGGTLSYRLLPGDDPWGLTAGLREYYQQLESRESGTAVDNMDGGGVRIAVLAVLAMIVVLGLVFTARAVRRRREVAD
jgi:hypothetical protein